MDLTLSDEQQLLAETARVFVERACPPSVVRSVEAGAPRPDLWRAMTDAGWPGLVIPEGHGGAGQGMVELAVLCEQLGRGAVPTPLVVDALTALLLVWAGDDAQRDRWLPALADGARVGTLAVLEEGMRDEWDVVTLRAVPVLSGEKILVPWAGTADLMVVVTADGLRILEPSAPSVRVEPHRALGGEPLGAVVFDGASAEPLGQAEHAAVMLERVLGCAAVVQLAYAVGVAERALELSVRHATDRHQFGRPIGSFQAIAHRCADMRADIDACRFLAYQAAWSLDHDANASLTVAAAKAFANDAIRRVFRHAHQVHGAIGFSTEHDLHLFTRRAKAFELGYGSTAHHLEHLAMAIGLAPPR